MNLFAVFVTGLTTGGLSCLAMQGGLLASVIANQQHGAHKSQATDDLLKRSGIAALLQKMGVTRWDVIGGSLYPVAIFLIAKLVAHAVLGFLLGALGSVFTMSLEMRLVFQVLTAAYLFATAMNMLDVHPIFRFVAFQPPKFLQRLVRSTSKSTTFFAPALLGFFTIFVPCGVTQAMEVVAINSGSAISGALILTVFVLGTSPVFALLGLFASRLTDQWTQRLRKVAAATLIAMAVYSLNGVLLVLNSPLTIQNVFSPVQYFFSQERFSQSDKLSPTTDGITQVTIGVYNNGYSPKYVQVKQGVPVVLTLKSEDTYSCALAFEFREFGISTFLSATDSKTFKFTPEKKGKFPFTCSMGMYSGIVEVI